MGAKQIKSCSNCRHSGVFMCAKPCSECNALVAIPSYDKWQSKRGRTKGTKSKPGSKKTGPISKPSGELMCFPVIPIKAKHLEAYGGIETLKEDVKQMVNEKIK